MSNIPVRAQSQNFEVFKSVGQLWTEYAYLAPANHTIEQVAHPKYFGALRTKFPKSPRPTDAGIRIGDFIHVKAENNLWISRFVVRDIPEGMDECHTELIEHLTFDAKDIPAGYEIAWRGAQRQWSISLNGEEIEAGFSTQEAAGKRVAWYQAQNRVIEKVRQAEARPARGRKPRVKTEDAESEAA